MKKVIVVIALVAAAVLAGYAAATPSSGTIVTQLVRAATGEPMKISVPETEVVWQKIKVRQGKKFVYKRVRREKIVDHALISCGGAASNCDIAVQTVTFQPGGETGWHSHSGSVMLIVKSGTLTRIEHDCEKETASAGQVMLETGHAHDKGMVVRNEGTVAAEAVIVYVVQKDAPLRVDMPAACS